MGESNVETAKDVMKAIYVPNRVLTMEGTISMTTHQPDETPLGTSRAEFGLTGREGAKDKA